MDPNDIPIVCSESTRYFFKENLLMLGIPQKDTCVQLLTIQFFEDCKKIDHILIRTIPYYMKRT